MAKKKEVVTTPEVKENISNQALEEVMGDRYATYAKYVIQDRAIPDARDGMKPVQRRIIYSMYVENNLSTRPTKKCAHTVGAVMGKYHPHGDSSIYEALARMSQDWKIRYPLVDFQGNNGSIDGDSPAAYRYTEARLSELADEMVRDIDKKVVDMALTFDDSDFEPEVLPARFPNLLVNGSEGIAVAIATEIPPHNLKEVVDSIVYRFSHPTCDIESLMKFIIGPDFPTGGVIYKSQGLKDIYELGRGRIEVASKCEIVQEKGFDQIIITEIPYKVVKIALVYEIDKIRHDKVIDGISEVRDESDRSGLRIVVDIKKDAKTDVILQYLLNKTSLRSSYSANMVAIVGGRPKTMTLIDFIDCYIAHQREVITRRSKFDVERFESRLHIIEGLIKAISILDEVVEVIKKSSDKADAKINIQKKFGFTVEQSEAIVTLQLYKLSNTDVSVLIEEKNTLEKDIASLHEILNDEKKLDKVIISDLRKIAAKYGDARKTQIIEKNEITSIDKRDLIAREDVMVSITKEGYIKRSSLKSFKGSGSGLPGMKSGDSISYMGQANTADFMLAFTSKGNYLYIPIHEIFDTKWNDEGKHVNYLISLDPQEKIVRALGVEKFRSDLFIIQLTRKGQIKRVALSDFEVIRYARPITSMKLMADDEVVDVCFTNGNQDLFIATNNGFATFFNENELMISGLKSGGVKAISSLGGASVTGVIPFHQGEKNKIFLLTDYGCVRIFDITYINRTSRLSKLTSIFRSFKSDIHHLVYLKKIDAKDEPMVLNVVTKNKETLPISWNDYHLTPLDKYAKTNLELPKKTIIESVYISEGDFIKKDIVSEYSPKQDIVEANSKEENEGKDELEEGDSSTKYEQISIFDQEENPEKK